jgi:phage-related protein
MSMLPVAFLGDSRDRLRDFPTEMREECGRIIRRLQRGLSPRDWKPFPQIGPAVREFRIWGEDGTFRVFYMVKTADAVYILHAFQKKTQQTPQKDIDLAIRRYREIGR